MQRLIILILSTEYVCEIIKSFKLYVHFIAVIQKVDSFKYSQIKLADKKNQYDQFQ